MHRLEQTGEITQSVSAINMAALLEALTPGAAVSVPHHRLGEGKHSWLMIDDANLRDSITAIEENKRQ